MNYGIPLFRTSRDGKNYVADEAGKKSVNAVWI